MTSRRQPLVQMRRLIDMFQACDSDLARMLILNLHTIATAFDRGPMVRI